MPQRFSSLITSRLSSTRFLLFLLSNPLYFSEALDNKTGQVRYPSVFTSASVLKKPGDLSPVDMSSSSVEATNTNKHSFVPLETSTWFQETAMRQEALNKCILPLTWAGHKGGSGRIGILGGSAQYTGAPFYASMASLKVGADLAFCFCAEEASIPIKSYSPELMVAPVYKAADFDSLVKTGQSRGNQAE